MATRSAAIVSAVLPANTEQSLFLVAQDTVVLLKYVIVRQLGTSGSQISLWTVSPAGIPTFFFDTRDAAFGLPQSASIWHVAEYGSEIRGYSSAGAEVSVSGAILPPRPV